MLPDLVEEKCFARVGLMGNPSDGFHGKTVSFLLSNFFAQVTITAQSKERGVEIHDPALFRDLEALHKHSHTLGYQGGLRLLQATCKIFTQFCQSAGITVHNSRGFVMTYSTNIPRMVGLSGSSAIIVAAFNALLKFFGLAIHDLNIAREEYPEVILSIERDELGISAGLQDRVIQCFGGLVHMDFSKEVELKNIYTELDPLLLPKMYLAYNINTGGDSGKVHSTVKQRWIDRDPELVQGMQELGRLADQAKECLLKKDYSALATLMDKNFSMRRKLYGDAVVGQNNIRVVELANHRGFGAKFTGSGGAIICLRKDGGGWLEEIEEETLRQEFMQFGYDFVRVNIPATSS